MDQYHVTCRRGGEQSDGRRISAATLLGALALLVIAPQLEAEAAPSPAESLASRAACSRMAVDSATTPGSLRKLADQCRDFPDLAILAVSKLNALPSPKPSMFLTRSKGADAMQHGVSVSADIAIFFGVGESYPTDEGISALRRFIEELNAGGAVVKSVFVLGSVDAAEADTQLGRPLARGRAAMLHDYLVAAGIDKKLITVAIRTGPGPGATVGSTTPADRMAKAIVVLEKISQQ